MPAVQNIWCEIPLLFSLFSRNDRNYLQVKGYECPERCTCKPNFKLLLLFSQVRRRVYCFILVDLFIYSCFNSSMHLIEYNPRHISGSLKHFRVFEQFQEERFPMMFYLNNLLRWRANARYGYWYTDILKKKLWHQDRPFVTPPCVFRSFTYDLSPLHHLDVHSHFLTLEKWFSITLFTFCLLPQSFLSISLSRERTGQWTETFKVFLGESF